MHHSCYLLALTCRPNYIIGFVFRNLKEFYSVYVCLSPYTVAEVFRILEIDDFRSSDVFILTHENPTRSDKGSNDGDIGNLTGNHLLADAKATVVVSGFEKMRLSVNDSSSSDDSSEESVETMTANRLLKRKRKTWADVPVVQQVAVKLAVTLQRIAGDWNQLHTRAIFWFKSQLEQHCHSNATKTIASKEKLHSHNDYGRRRVISGSPTSHGVETTSMPCTYRTAASSQSELMH